MKMARLAPFTTRWMSRPRDIRPQLAGYTLDARKMLIATDASRERSLEVSIADVPRALPAWSERLELPASLTPAEMATVLGCISDHPASARLVLRRPWNGPADLHILQYFPRAAALEELEIDEDFEYRAPPAHGRERRIDLSPMSTMTELRKLRISGGWRLDDLDALQHLTRLETLDLSLWSSFRCKLHDLRPLRYMAQLRELRIEECYKLHDLRPLAGLGRLERLALRSPRLRDLGPLASLSHLEWLRIWPSAVSDLHPLKGAAALKVVELRNCPVVNIEPLATLTQLEKLDLHGTRIRDVRALAKLHHLRRLDLSDTAVDDVTPLEHCRQLRKLNLEETSVVDIGSLAGLIELRDLSVRGTGILPAQLRELSLPRTELDGLSLTPATESREFLAWIRDDDYEWPRRPSARRGVGATPAGDAPTEADTTLSRSEPIGAPREMPLAAACTDSERLVGIVEAEDEGDDDCQCIHRSEFPPMPTDEVIGPILRGEVALRAQIEQLLGEPSYIRCDRCDGHDVEYIFEANGTPMPLALIFKYFEGRVLSVLAHSRPVRAAQQHAWNSNEADGPMN